MIYTYEVEFSVSESGKQSDLITRKEYCYSINDSVSQALYNSGVVLGENVKIKILYVGPPRDLISNAINLSNLSSFFKS